MTSAAIFNLDRTLVPASSARVFQRHLGREGLPVRSAGLQTAVCLHELSGENPLGLQLGPLMAQASKGWSIARVERAAIAAAEELEAEVPAFARGLIDEHRHAGRRIVLATSAPEPLVTPFARRLGIEDVIASRWRDDGENFTGRAQGAHLWGRAKRDALFRWASRQEVDLVDSYAYSGTSFDLPLLRSVGHPVAVNPDLQLRMVARINRWPVRHLDVPPGVVKIAGHEIQDWLRPFIRPEFVQNARFEITGTANVPREGGVIVVFNHRSYFDATAVGLALVKVGRPARFLGKKELFQMPVVGRLSEMVGGIPVDRGSGSDEPLERAVQAVEAGELVALAPQGTIPRGPEFFDPALRGRWGAARLAHATRAPVVPMGVWGTDVVWPRNRRLPKLDAVSPPRVTVNIGEPVSLGHESLDGDTKKIMAAISALLPAAARFGRSPTPSELARTYPPGSPNQRSSPNDA